MQKFPPLLLPETLVSLDLERVGANVLRVTVVTEMGYPENLIGLVGLTRRDLRAISAQEVRLRCMPWNMPEAIGAKGPTVLRRWTGPLDWYLLGYASRGAMTIDGLSAERFAAGNYYGVSDAWPKECDRPAVVTKAPGMDRSYDKDTIVPFEQAGRRLN